MRAAMYPCIVNCNFFYLARPGTVATVAVAVHSTQHSTLHSTQHYTQHSLQRVPVDQIKLKLKNKNLNFLNLVSGEIKEIEIQQTLTSRDY